MDELNETPETETSNPLIPPEPLPPIESRFLFVDVAALRAKQLKRGARPRIEGTDAPVPHKAERLAIWRNLHATGRTQILRMPGNISRIAEALGVTNMLWTLFVVLLVLWVLGLVSSYTLGGFIHILLVLAIVALVFQLLSGRRAV